MENHARYHLVKSAPAQDRNRIVSCSNKYANFWLTQPTEDTISRVYDTYFKHCVRLRIGLPPADRLPANCPLCHQPFRQDNAHFLSCIKQRRRCVNDMHNTVVRRLQDHLILYLNAIVLYEPNPLDSDAKRPDPHAILPDGSEVMIDVVVETSGAFGKSAMNFTQQMAELAESLSICSTGNFKRALVGSISAAVQNGNALAIIDELNSITERRLSHRGN
eukprot:TRINITY_DN1134_c0_g1_i1.p1 TRINITY_DN1134_c0_g1~~TRINITY_DN1134_c0_g1_i1.p1  ORF type:complete len:219 (-),score=18.20 TRINITY_DN1134_c0_g1_i1:202-858(-)